ncbi:MAG: serine/threonine-protein kinase [Verrucomicrobiales bacterium]|nr:serine/threonine-protein kinase [Verrucomicrobiales bacterium]
MEDTLLTGVGERGEALPPPPCEAIAPKFPQLEILECLGRGGMGVVYKARQKSLDRLVALKLLAPEKEKDPAFAERFVTEAQALARLDHPNIVTVHDFGETEGFFYLLMEYVDGVNLRAAMGEGQLEAEQALTIVPPICEALEFAHERGIVHRDIKPENLLLGKDGKVKIADFGIAKLMGQERVDEEGIVGTPRYMAPEQGESAKKTDHRADIYSLGVVLYEMLTGEVPQRGDVLPPSRCTGVDPKIDEVVLRALESEPGKRYQTAGEFATRLEGVPSGMATVAAASAGLRSGGGQENSDAEGGSSLSKMAVIGFVWGTLFILTAALSVMTIPTPVTQGDESAGPAWWTVVLRFTLLPAGLSAPIGATLLGWFSVKAIQRSGGQLYGMRLAVLDGLMFPLLLLDCVIAALFWWLSEMVGKAIERATGGEELSVMQVLFLENQVGIVVVSTLVVVLVVDLLIYLAVWRRCRVSA